jgi:hypothetical protein
MLSCPYLVATFVLSGYKKQSECESESEYAHDVFLTPALTLFPGASQNLTNPEDELHCNAEYSIFT